VPKNAWRETKRKDSGENCMTFPNRSSGEKQEAYLRHDFNPYLQENRSKEAKQAEI